MKVSHLRNNFKSSPTAKNRKALYKIQSEKQQRYHERKFGENQWSYVEQNLKSKSHPKVPSDADRVVKYFQDNYESTDSVIDTSFLPTYHNPHSLFNNTAIKPKDIRLALKKTKSTSAPGPDDINCQLLKNVWLSSISLLHSLIAYLKLEISLARGKKVMSL